MALEAVNPVLRDLLHRTVLLVQDRNTWWEATPLDAHDCRVYLAVLTQAGAPGPATGSASLQVTDATGLIRLEGTLLGSHVLDLNGVGHVTWELLIDPAKVQRLNRRSHFRVPVGLKGEVAALTPEEFEGVAAAPGRPPATLLEALARQAAGRRHPCVVRDLSTGGALLAMASPPPRAKQQVLLDVALGHQNILRNLPATVVEGRADALVPPFDARVRLRFAPLPAAADARLARHVLLVQREILKKGVKG